MKNLKAIAAELCKDGSAELIKVKVLSAERWSNNPYNIDCHIDGSVVRFTNQNGSDDWAETDVDTITLIGMDVREAAKFNPYLSARARQFAEADKLNIICALGGATILLLHKKLVAGENNSNPMVDSDYDGVAEHEQHYYWPVAIELGGIGLDFYCNVCCKEG